MDTALKQPLSRADLGSVFVTRNGDVLTLRHWHFAAPHAEFDDGSLRDTDGRYRGLAHQRTHGTAPRPAQERDRDLTHRIKVRWGWMPDTQKLEDVAPCPQ